MKNIKNILKSAALIGVTVFSATSCDDWLTIYPQDRVVEENFWEDKSDLEGARNAAYKTMLGSMRRFFLWGDLRSDAYDLLEPEGTAEKEVYRRYLKIVDAMPDSSMAEFEWGNPYTTINYCNKVLQHGPEVLQRDKQFTKLEWTQMQAEMIALRALNYFYLLRAFKDIPYTTGVVNSDAEVGYFGPTNQLAVLDSCIASIEGNPNWIGSGILDEGVNRFPAKRDTKGFFTNAGIYAMLADMYLWRASLYQGHYSGRKDMGTTKYPIIFHGENGEIDTVDFHKVNGKMLDHTVESDYESAGLYAEKALALLKRQNDEEGKGYGASKSAISDFGLGEVLPNVELIDNQFPVASQFSSLSSNYQLTIPSITSTFYTGNSRESILELQVSGIDGSKNDNYNTFFYMNNKTYLSASFNSLNAAYGTVGDQEMDVRVLCSGFNSVKETDGKNYSFPSQKTTNYYITKFATPEVRFKSEGESRTATVFFSRDQYSNYILYRAADMMLIKAEAIACKKDLKREDKENVKKICSALRRRSYCPYKKDAETLIESVSNIKWDTQSMKCDAVGTDAIDMVMNERLIEFMGEGKRWFDLVRYAERNSTAKKSEISDVQEEFKGETNNPDVRDSLSLNDGANGVFYMAKKYLAKNHDKGEGTLISRIKNRYGLYCPIHEMEVKCSKGLLPQNPVWNKSKYDK